MSTNEIPMMTEKELERSAMEIKAVENSSKIEIGRILTEVKGRTEHGRFTEFVENEVDFSPRQARRYMTLFNDHGKWTHASNLSDTQLFELANITIDDRPLYESVIEEIQTENDIVVPVTTIRAAKSMLTGHTEVNVEDVKAALLSELNKKEEKQTRSQSSTMMAAPSPQTNYNTEERSDASKINELAHYLAAAADIMWDNQDLNSSEIARALTASNGMLPRVDNMKRKLELVFDRAGVV